MIIRKGDLVSVHIGERERAKDRALDNRMEDRDKCNKTFLSVAGVRSTKFYF